jgi:uncharacterized protein YebE (UPF0316 family)
MSTEFLTWAGLGSAFLIFFLRVGDMSLDTIRVLFVVRGNKKLAWILGFVQSIIYVVAISSVLSHLDNPLNVIGYAAGFATGNVVGMLIDDRMAIGHVQLSIISSTRGTIIAEQLREAGFGVTEIPARGKDGTVSMLSVSVLRKDVSRAESTVRETDADAFITKEDVRPVRRGFWHA